MIYSFDQQFYCYRIKRHVDDRRIIKYKCTSNCTTGSVADRPSLLIGVRVYHINVPSSDTYLNTAKYSNNQSLTLYAGQTRYNFCVSKSIVTSCSRAKMFKLKTIYGDRLVGLFRSAVYLNLLTFDESSLQVYFPTF